MHPYIPLTDTQHNALTGSMLGDGHLHKDMVNANLMIGRSVKDQYYLRYERNIFNNFIPPRHKDDIGFTSYFDKRSGMMKTGCLFATIVSPTFTPYYSLWYLLNEETNRYVKIVPANLELNGQIIAHWIAD